MSKIWETKMSGTIRKTHSDEFKFKVALTAIKGEKSVVEMCQEFGVAQGQIYLWKQQLENAGPSLFADKRKADNQKEQVDKLHRIIGQITVERDFLARVLNRSK